METIIGPSWASFAWRGAASVLFGVALLAWPRVTLAALVIVFGAYLLADGALALAIAARRGPNPHRWLLIVDAVIGVAAGTLVVLWPRMGLLALILIVGVRALLVGGVQVGAAWQLRNVIPSPWLFGLGGLFTIVFGLVTLMLPGVTALVLVTLAAVYAIFFGAVLLGLAYLTWRAGETLLVDVPAS
jgi:uncharacterized membrane protein HdeD (DUF308 family)